MKSISALGFFCLLMTTATQAQNHQQTIEMPSYGISFDIPQGWTAEESGDVYLLQSPSEKGFIALSLHELSSIEALEQEAKHGLVDENGTSLQLSSALTSFKDKGLRGMFSGTIEWQPAKAVVFGLLSPHGGGVTVMAATGQDDSITALESTAQQIAASFRFFKPKVSAETLEWRQTFMNCRLTYMNTYSSSDYGGGYSGYSDKTVIDLCAAGYFTYTSNSHSSFDSQGGFGYAHSDNDGNGTWEVVSRGNLSVLLLKFYDGTSYEYELDYQDGKTLLNGSRYFRTYTDDSVADHQPNCY